MLTNSSLEATAATPGGVLPSSLEKESPGLGRSGRPNAKRAGNGRSEEAAGSTVAVEAESQPTLPDGASETKLSQSTTAPGDVINKVILSGRAGRTAEVRHTKDGRMVTNFTVGTDDSYQDRLGEWQKRTIWHRVQVWGEIAETVSPGLVKGARVYVEGKLIHRSWVDKQNKRRISTEVVASDVRFLDPAPRKETVSDAGVAPDQSGGPN